VAAGGARAAAAGRSFKLEATGVADPEHEAQSQPECECHSSRAATAFATSAWSPARRRGRRAQGPRLGGTVTVALAGTRTLRMHPSPIALRS
jgi:hypothetical protein